MRAALAVSERHVPAAANMTMWARALLQARGHTADATGIAERLGAPACVREVIKAALPVGKVPDIDMGGLAASATITTGFIPFLSSASVFYRMVDGGMLQRIPLNTRVGIVSASATGWIAGEGKATPVSRLTIPTGLTGLEPIRAHAIACFTKELVDSMSSAAETTIARELRRAIAEAVDGEFFSRVIDGETVLNASTGENLDDANLDIARLVQAVSPRANSSLIFAGSPDVINRAATAYSADAFPDLGVAGGFIRGIPAMPIDALPGGTLALIDGASIAGDADAITLAASNETSLELEDEAPAQDATTGTGANLISLWQSDLVALLATARFGVYRARPNAVALCNNINWGGDLSPDSAS